MVNFLIIILSLFILTVCHIYIKNVYFIKNNSNIIICHLLFYISLISNYFNIYVFHVVIAFLNCLIQNRLLGIICINLFVLYQPYFFFLFLINVLLHYIHIYFPVILIIFCSKFRLWIVLYIKIKVKQCITL